MEGIIRAITSHCRSEPGLQAIYLFGSIAKGKDTAESDIDVGLLYDHVHVPTSAHVFDLKATLAKQLKRDVDLVVMNVANPIIRHQIYRTGRCILNLNRRQATRFFVRTMSQYADVKRMRRPIEQSILKGRRYGR